MLNKNLLVKPLLVSAVLALQVGSAAPAFATTSSGVASWYGPGFHGRTTANGESFNQYGLTAAHKTLAFGTEVLVTNTSNGQSVVVRINDRGPYARGRVIDLSRGAAEAVGMINAGTAQVTIEVIE